MEQFECQHGLPTSHNNGSTKRANISKSFFCSYFLFAKWGSIPLLFGCISITLSFVLLLGNKDEILRPKLSTYSLKASMKYNYITRA